MAKDTVAVYVSVCPVCAKRLHLPEVPQTRCRACGAIAYCCEQHLHADHQRHLKRCGSESCIAIQAADPQAKNEWVPVNETERASSVFVLEKNLQLGTALARVNPNPMLARYANLPDFVLSGLPK